MGAGLSVQVLNATVFLSLDQKWQYIFQGFLIVAAALIYSQVRRGGPRATVRRSAAPTYRHVRGVHHLERSRIRLRQSVVSPVVIPVVFR